VVVKNKIIGAIDVFRDITKEKELEKMRMDFLSLASHQLRTPLSGTKWLIETMQKGITGKIEPKEKEYLDSLYQMNERMIKLVFDMLNVLRLESGSEAIKKEVISISDLYKDLIVLMSAPAKSKGVILNTAISEQQGKKIKIETDIQLLKSILECFVSNAINYTPSGQEVILDAREEKNMVIFSVKDDGIGIPQDEQAKIFERFYRASNAKLIRPDGTGLGLYIAKMLAEKIGGKIYFDSKDKKGSTFYLSIQKKVV
jgi:signal transduction histidine kinase